MFVESFKPHLTPTNVDYRQADFDYSSAAQDEMQAVPSYSVEHLASFAVKIFYMIEIPFEYKENKSTVIKNNGYKRFKKGTNSNLEQFSMKSLAII